MYLSLYSSTTVQRDYFYLWAIVNHVSTTIGVKSQLSVLLDIDPERELLDQLNSVFNILRYY